VRDQVQYSLGEVWAKYKGSQEWGRLALSTRTNAERATSRLAHMMSMPIDHITRSTIIMIMDDLTPANAYIFGSRMRVLFRWAVDRSMMRENPVSGIKLPTSGEYRHWTDEEHARLLSLDIDPQMRMAVSLAFYTAQRVSDVLNMKWSDINSVGPIYVKQKKTGTELHIPVHPELKKRLDTHPKIGRYIISMPGGERYQPNSFNRKFARIRSKLGLPKDLHFHGLRKTIASKLKSNGASIEEIMQLGGWKSHAQASYYCKGADQYKMAKSAIEKI